MCGLVVTKLNLQRVPFLPFPKNNAKIAKDRMLKGSIEVHAARDPEQFCLPAFGPLRGQLDLKRGFELPSLPDGVYTVSINGEKVGHLEISEKGIVLSNL